MSAGIFKSKSHDSLVAASRLRGVYVPSIYRNTAVNMVTDELIFKVKRVLPKGTRDVQVM